MKSLDSILHAIYDVISGPAGDRDWNRFRSLFVPEARLTSNTRRDGGPVRLLDVEGFASGAGNYFKTHPFYESAIVNRVQKFGNIAQVFSSYESRTAPTEKPFARGVNSIQLFNDSPFHPEGSRGPHFPFPPVASLEGQGLCLEKRYPKQIKQLKISIDK